jgi:hypothetical protein
MALFGVILLAGLALGGFYYYTRVYLPKQTAPEVAQQPTTPAVPVETPVPSAVPQETPAPVTTPPAVEPSPITPPARTQRAPVETVAPRRQDPAPVAQPVTTPPPAAAQAPVQASPQPVQATAPIEPAPAPVRETPAPQAPAPAVKAPVTPAAPSYSGPTSGVVVWSGRLEKNGTITINGDSASSGSLKGGLPAIPVMIEVQPNDVGVVEAPGPSNGWRRMVLRSRVNRSSVVTIRWQALGR